MKICKYTEFKHKQQSSGWFLTFFSGIILGGFIVWWNKDKFLQDSYFLGEEVFKRFSYTSIYKEGFFYYILKNRIKLYLILILSSFTILMNFTFCVFFFWSGLSIGVIVITLVLKFGINSILLLFGLIFPHFFIYVPCFFGLMKYLYKFKNAGKISSQYNFYGKSARNESFYVFLFMILGFFAVLFGGILLESYVNPIVLKKLVKLLY